jgi:hypothetical protein
MKFSRTEQRRADFISRVILPKGALGGTTDDCDLGAEIGRQFSLTPWWSAIITRIGILVVWYSPLFLLGKLRTFGSIAVEQQQAILQQLAHSPNYWVREMSMILKMNACNAGMSGEAVMRYLGAYDFGQSVQLKRSRS